MKNLYGAHQLSAYGIGLLTGESCAYGMRVLCDLSERGRTLLCQFFGVPDISFPPNWNTRVGDEPAVASVLLTRETLAELMKFVLFHTERCDVIVRDPAGHLVGLKKTDEYFDSYLAMAQGDSRVFTVMYNPTNPSASVGGRNVHAFTGRVE